jgi:hypothetical protein
VVIGWAEKQELMWIRLGYLKRCNGHSRSGVFSFGFQNEASREASLLYAFNDEEAMFIRSNADGSRVKACNTLECELQEALVVYKGHELFGKALAREWPESGTGATTENDRLDACGHRNSVWTLK